jgi:hypothetical protein
MKNEKYPLWRESEEKKEFILKNLNLLEECQIDAIYLDVQDKFNKKSKEKSIFLFEKML